MSLPDAVVEDAAARMTTGQVVNDFNIQISTINGSGSQTANLLLMRAIFQMGIPVSGKNLFPSNIAGLPTWYTIRVSQDGYVGRRREIDFLVAMNRATARDDVMALPPRAAVIYDEPLELSGFRDDVSFYPVPFDKLVAEVCSDAKLRRLVRNVIYDGVLAKILGVDMAQLELALNRQLGRKVKALALNQAALQAGFEFADQHLTKEDRFSLAPMDATQGKILIDGNAAAALGALMAGVTVVAWYPITPSSSLCETLIEYLRKYRIDAETGKATFAVVQAEDEVAAIGMALGAGWSGARSMTSTSGPGISLMSEFAGLGYYAEVPTVIFDIQRVGPSTGFPTRTSQGDILSTAVLSHGDSKHVLLLPSSVKECYVMAQQAFDIAERLQTPVFVMSDLDLGMNNWMSDPFDYPEKPMDRGKLLDDEVLSKIGKWGRYKDVDGDGIPYRTIPGDGMPTYFCRGSGHNELAEYSESAADYEDNLKRLNQKFDTARKLVPGIVVERAADGPIGVIAYGSSHWSTIESCDQLVKMAGVTVEYARLRAYPFHADLGEFIDRHERVYVIEQNRDAQLLSLMRMELSSSRLIKLRSVLHYSGLPIDAQTITESVLAQEGCDLEPAKES